MIQSTIVYGMITQTIQLISPLVWVKSWTYFFLYNGNFSIMVNWCRGRSLVLYTGYHQWYQKIATEFLFQFSKLLFFSLNEPSNLNFTPLQEIPSVSLSGWVWPMKNAVLDWQCIKSFLGSYTNARKWMNL